MSYNLIVGADIAPTASNYQLFNNGSAEELVGEELLALLHSADGVFLNLETPLTDKPCPIEKCGPNLIAPSSTINGLAAIESCLYGLANNHIMDQGAQGLTSTMALLEQAGISYFGAGNNLSEAAEPIILEGNDLKIGLYACAEHEFSTATETHPGANPYDPLEAFDHIQSLKLLCDFVVVIYHGGKELYRYPSPLLQKTCRKFVEKGADLVICQHSHCVGCEEAYLSGRIIYGQGNFLLDLEDTVFWKTGIATSIHFDKQEGFRLEHLPLVKKGNTVRLASGNERSAILEGFTNRSKQIEQPGFIEQEYTTYAKQHMRDYQLRLLGFTFFSKLMNKLSVSSYFKRRYNRAAKLAIANMVDCEAHREFLSTGLMHDNQEKEIASEVPYSERLHSS